MNPCRRVLAGSSTSTSWIAPHGPSAVVELVAEESPALVSPLESPPQAASAGTRAARRRRSLSAGVIEGGKLSARPTPRVPQPSAGGGAARRAPALAATTSAIATSSRAARSWPSATKPTGPRPPARGSSARRTCPAAAVAAPRARASRGSPSSASRPRTPIASTLGSSRSEPPAATRGISSTGRDHHREREPDAAGEGPADPFGEDDVGGPEGAGERARGRPRARRVRRRGSARAARSRRPRAPPRAGRARRREAANATPSGPTNSNVTAIPSGIRSSAR